MPRRQSVPVVKIAPRVTREHGEIFVSEWFPTAFQGEEVSEAFTATALMAWPESDPNRPLGQFGDSRQGRYLDIEDEILEQTFAAVRPAVAEAFVKAAQRVLARERKRQK